jgi:hypothetical protein
MHSSQQQQQQPAAGSTDSSSQARRLLTCHSIAYPEQAITCEAGALQAQKAQQCMPPLMYARDACCGTVKTPCDPPLHRELHCLAMEGKQAIRSHTHDCVFGGTSWHHDNCCPAAALSQANMLAAAQ